jgi:glycerol-3-phosphate acyltransferase PlsY
MIILSISICFAIAYFIGAIPSSVWYGKRFHGVDVRQFGSGNAGATNTFRVLGRKAGIIVFLTDVSKGLIAGSLANGLYKLNLLTYADLEPFQILFGLTAIFGHIFSVFVKFKGGKGVATSLGLGICLYPMLAFACFILFLVILAITHYVSVGSMLSTLAFPLLTYSPWFYAKGNYISGLGFVAFGIVVYTHRKNIQKLISGTENKIYLFKKPTKTQS